MKPMIQQMVFPFVLFLAFCVPAFAAKTEVTAEGKYVMGDLDSKKDAKALALLEAKRMALEKAGTYIESLSEVKDYQLNKDQVSSLAAGVMSVEVLKEDWKMSGENMVVVIAIRAVVDTSNLKSRITALQEGQGAENFKEIQGQLAALQKELADLKAQQAAVKGKTSPKPDIREKHEGIIKKMSALEYLENGNAALLAQRWDGAVDSYEKALALDPKQGDAYAGISLALFRKGEKEKAFDAVNKALTLDPQSARGHAAKAALLLDQRKYGEALTSINTAIKIKPMNPRQYLVRGEIYLKLRQRDQALRDFDQACKMRLPMACQRADMVGQRPRVKPDSDDRPRPAGPEGRKPRRSMPPRGE